MWGSGSYRSGDRGGDVVIVVTVKGMIVVVIV